MPASLKDYDQLDYESREAQTAATKAQAVATYAKALMFVAIGIAVLAVAF